MKDVLSIQRIFRPFLFAFILFGVQSAAHAQQFELSGRMQFSSIEGGCWSLQGFDGKQYELFGDPESLAVVRKDFAIVDLTVEPVKNGASTCMIGEIVRIVTVNNVRMQPYDAPITPTSVNGIMHRTKSGVWYVREKNGIRYEFQKPPAKKYRRIGVRYKAHVMINSDAKLSREHMDGVILPPLPTNK